MHDVRVELLGVLVELIACSPNDFVRIMRTVRRVERHGLIGRFNELFQVADLIIANEIVAATSVLKPKLDLQASGSRWDTKVLLHLLLW